MKTKRSGRVILFIGGAWCLFLFFNSCLDQSEVRRDDRDLVFFEQSAGDEAYDSSQNYQTGIQTWISKKVRPPLISNSSRAKFGFSCNAEYCLYQCQLDNGRWKACSSPIIYKNLDEGPHSFRVKAEDPSGNSDPTPASYRWAVQYPQYSGSWAPTSGSEMIAGYEGQTAVWTGTEMIVWGGYSNVGGRYNPATDFWMATSTANAPSERTYHSAVWTGTEMIVWGGYGANYTYFKNGGRYNPALDSWSLTSANNAPSERKYHTAVWTGSEMIIWGGYYFDGTNPYWYNTGGKYNPASDSWTITSTVNAPSARYSHIAVWTGTEMIIWGGDSGHLNTGGKYNPITDSWIATSTLNAPSGRSGHKAIWTGSRMIIWGGNIGYLSYTNTGGIYDPAANSWEATSVANAPAGRGSHTAVWTGAEMIVWGGGNGTDTFNSGGRYNPSANSWTATSTINAPSKRSAHTAVWTGTEMIIWGGYYAVYSGGRYNPATDSWTATAIMLPPSARAHHSAVWTGTKMIIWGGTSGYMPDENYNDGSSYDPVTDSWWKISVLDAPSARSYHTAVWTGEEMIVWGGVPDGGEFGDPGYNTGGRYNPATDSWKMTSVTNAPYERGYHTAVWTGEEMIIWGGWNRGDYLKSGGRYNPTTDSWIPTSENYAPRARVYHSAIWTGTEMIIWGGANYNWTFGYTVKFNTGARYNPEYDSWKITSTKGAPSERYWHTAVWTGTEMIIWGGYDGGHLNSGGRYNPGTNSWRSTQTTEFVPARELHSAVWTGTEMIIYGGVNGSNIGGAYNPSTNLWNLTALDNAPAPRTGHTAVWTGTEMIIWGGYGSAGYLNTGARYVP